MSFFLEEWVRTRLGASIDFSQIGCEFFDGKLFFKILQSYDVVGPEVKQFFCRAKTEEEALRNLNLLRVTFKLLGVLKDDNVLTEISRKNGSVCIDLLNELYLRLCNKHALPLVTEGKERQLLEIETGRFQVSKVLEKECQLPTKKRPEERLLSRLKNSIKVFEKNACGDFFKPNKDKNRDRLREVSRKAREEIEKKIKECKCGVTVDECLRKFDEKLEQQAAGDYIRSICPPDEYVQMLKLRTIKQASDKEMESKLRDIIVKRIWCQQMQQREEEFRCLLAEKLLKQSNYERGMAQRLGQIHLQQRRMADKRRQIHEEAQRIYMERLETIEWRKHSLTDLDRNREKQRLLDLHRKIFDERVAKARDERLSMIKDIVSDIVDFSLKIIIFKLQNSVQPSFRELKEWKIMFFKALPLFPKMEDLISERDFEESILEEESFDSFVEKDELIDEVFNSYALNEYLILLGPWAKELWPELESVEEEMNVLGFAVHRLLDFKYPLPLPPEPADVPLYPFRVVVNNINDNKATKKLKSLLEKPKIDVIELPALINSSVACYKKEMGLDVKPSKKKKKEEAKSKKAKKKTKEEEPRFKSMVMQFPSLTEIEIKISKLAELGKKVFEILATGSPVPDELATEILIEHLRNMDDREGWVLVNFPYDCRQVHCMESTFTGMEPPIKCIFRCENENGTDDIQNSHELVQEEMFCEDFSVRSECYDFVKLNELRTSKLLPRPNPAPPTRVFESYFTNFIQLETGKGLASNEKEVKKDSFTEVDEEDLSKESSIEEQTPKLFYESTDIYLYFPYNKLDFSTIKRLARAIIAEIDEPGPERKSSVELFGDIAKEKPKKEKKMSRKATKNKSIRQSEIPKEDSIPEDEFNLLEETTVPKEESLPCEVAEPCWLFTTLEMPDETKVTLATFWESIELIYIQNLTELFSFYREHDSIVVPYRNSVFRRLSSIAETVDERQDLIAEFQSQLNDVDDILRAHGDMKKEMFCRIFELQLKLWELCDTKKTTGETERKDIINENWLPKHLCELFNIYVSMMETEIDRFSDSIQFLYSYYIASFGKPLPSTLIEKWYFPRYKISDFEIVEEDSTNSVTENETSALENVSSIQQISEKSLEKRILDVTLPPDGIIELYAEILTNPDYDTDFEDPFTEKINEIVTKIMIEISTTANQQFNIIEKERKLLNPTKTAKSRAATAKKKGKKVSREFTGKDKDQPQIEKTESEQEALRKEALRKEDLQKALAEWTKAVQNELGRTEFRLLLIKNRFINDLIELQDLMKDTFHSLQDDISRKYFDQTRNCDDLLRVLMTAVEAETKIDPKLILNLDHFKIQPAEISSICIPPPPVTPIQEYDEDFTFTVEQLKRFAEKMLLVSPLGITVESLIAIIEDMVLVGKENGHPFLPKGWSQMNRIEIRKTIKGIFGDIVMADWKDFLVLGLEFRFPSLQEIIETRDKFISLDPHRTEIISEADFMGTTLWFEKDLRDSLSGDLRVVLGKKFLYNLYKVGDNRMNYTAFLLNYCKDENPIDGFGKALALTTGYGYVLSENKLYLLMKENEKKESFIIAEQIINILLQDALNRAEGTVITEVDDDGNPIKHFEEEYVSNDYGFFLSEKLLETAASSSESFKSIESKCKRMSKRISKARSRTSNTQGKKGSSVEEAIEHFPSQKLLDITQLFYKSEQIVEYKSAESNIVWKSWIHKELALSLILASLQSYALPEDKFYVQTEVEEAISSLYLEKGIRNCIQGHVLAQSEFIQDLFSKCFKFKLCHLAQLIKTIMDSNRPKSVANTF